MIRSVNHTTTFTIAAADGVLVSPISIVRAEWSARRLVLSSCCGRVRNAPDIDTHPLQRGVRPR